MLSAFMSVSLTRVVAAVIERGNRVLVALRPPEKRYGGMWEFPGGKVEPTETDLEALRRELAEELGLQVVSTSRPVAAFQDPGSRFLVVFVPVVADGEPECREHAAIRWVAWPDLAALPLAPTDCRFVAACGDNRR
jgi:mutator protein MutT